MQKPDYRTRRGTVWVYLDEHGHAMFSVIEPCWVVAYNGNTHQEIMVWYHRNEQHLWTINPNRLFPDLLVPVSHRELVQINGDGTVVHWWWYE